MYHDSCMLISSDINATHENIEEDRQSALTCSPGACDILVRYTDPNPDRNILQRAYYHYLITGLVWYSYPFCAAISKLWVTFKNLNGKHQENQIIL